MLKKDLQTQISELKRSRNLINTALSLYSEGKHEQIIVVVDQLYALLYPGKNTGEGLLLRLASQMRAVLKCFIPVQSSDIKGHKTIIDHNPIAMSPTKKEFMVEYELKEALSKRAFVYNYKVFTVGQVITRFRHTEAGHYDENLKPSLEVVKKVRMTYPHGTFPRIEVSLIQIGGTILELSDQLIQKFEKN